MEGNVEEEILGTDSEENKSLHFWNDPMSQ